MCVSIFFLHALFVHGKPNFLSKTIDKRCKKIGPGFEPTVANCKTKVFTTVPLPCIALVMHRNHVETAGRKFGCRSELHTHPAHKEMQMGSLCALLFFW